MISTDGTELASQFTHEEIARLGSLGRIKNERDYFDPNAAQKRLLHSQASTSALVGRLKRRFEKKDAYCEVALELHRKGHMKFTDAAINASKHLLMGKVMEMVADRLPSGELELFKSENYAKPPSARTLRRWLADIKAQGLTGHLDNISKRGNRRSRFSPEEIAIIHKGVNGYMSLEKPMIKQVHENIQLDFRKRNEERARDGKCTFTPPSYESVRRKVKALDPYRVVLTREGEAAARKKFRPFLEGVLVTRPMERIEIDEWTVDVSTLLESTEIYGMLTDEEKRTLGLYVDGDEKDPQYKAKVKRTDRWVVTAAICCATKSIVALVISRAPNSEAAVQLLQMITTNKGAWSDAVGCLTQWDMHGTPELIVFDGGNAFKSIRFRTAAEDLGVRWQMAMNGVPENRGTIERVFRTFATDFAPRLSGHTFSSIMQKGDADPEKRAALNLDDFTFALIRWVVDIYHNTEHGMLGGDTPVQAWRRLTKEYGVAPPPSSQMTRLCFGQHLERRLDKSGITVLGVRYQSEIIQKFMRRKDPRKVDVRWHPKDIGAISVNINEEWFEVPAMDPALSGVPAQAWLTAVRHVRSATPKGNRLNNQAVREAIVAIEDRNKAAMGKAGLNLEDWSEARLEGEERKTLAGVKFYDPAAPTPTIGELGQTIPNVADLTGSEVASEQSSPKKTSKRKYTLEDE